MHTQATPTRAQRLAAALAVTDSSARLQAALTAGTRPEPSFVEPLIARCAVEPDFSVREMLTWALLRLPVELVLPRVLAELDPATASSALGQSQALHTVSKLCDPRAWPAITGELLHSSDEEIARTAWRAAVAVAPADARPELAAALVRELGRGDRELHRSLSRAIVGIGDPALPALTAALDAATARGDAAVAGHARATIALLADPDAGFAYDPADAVRMGVAYSGTPRAH